MKLAERFRIPIITFIDTSGADPSLQSERHGIGSAIATTLSLMSELETRIVSVIIGEGGGEGALSITISDNILMMENAIYTPMSPEKAASVFYNNQGLAAEVAKTLKLTSTDAHHLGIIDTIVREPKGGAHLNHTEAAHRLDRELIKALSTLQKQSMRRLLRLRYKKFRNIGEYSSHFRLAVKKEVTNFKEYIKFIRSEKS
jgi:acetyl-CoA carboxylase carboxyl transferase subunit alpha